MRCAEVHPIAHTGELPMRAGQPAQGACCQAELIRGLSPEYQLTRDDVTKSSSGEGVGGEMRLERNARESHGGGKTVGQPTMPRRMGIAHGKCSSHGHYGDLVAGRHTAEATEPAPFPDF